MRRTLLKTGSEPVLGIPKSGRSRAITISPQTASLLRKHQLRQKELRLSLGGAYKDRDFVFAKENGLLLPEYDGLKEHHVRTYRQSERQEVCSSRRVFPKWEAGQP